MKRSPSEKDSLSFDTFCFMAVEEFLMKKNMTQTLKEFRSEWVRPDENVSLLSWYEISLKLQLSECMGNSSLPTVLENITHTLMQDSSTRMRKPVEVTALSRSKMVSTSGSFPLTSTAETENVDLDMLFSNPEESGRPSPIRSMPVLNDRKKGPLIKRQVDSKSKTSGTPGQGRLPEAAFLKALDRDLKIARENLMEATVLEAEKLSKMRRSRMSELEKAHVEEDLGRIKKQKCGCCCLSFSLVNLTLSVTNKAVIDLRKSWQSRENPVPCLDVDERLSKAPRCYDEVRVCMFCAQFFQNQPSYRPSFEAAAAEERRKAAEAKEIRDKQYWDPLKMCEKNR